MNYQFRRYFPPLPPFVFSIEATQLYIFDFHDDSRSSTLPSPSTSPTTTVHRRRSVFTNRPRAQSVFRVKPHLCALPRFPRPDLLKFESRIKFLWFDDIFFYFWSKWKSLEEKRREGRRGGILIEATTFEAKSSSPSSSSLRFLEVCRFTFSGKKDQGIPLSGFDPWTLSSFLNFPGKVSPLFVVFF